MKKNILFLAVIIILFVSCAKKSVETSVSGSDEKNNINTVTNLHVQKVSSTFVDVIWEKPENVTEFEIYKATNGGNFEKVATTQNLNYHDESVSGNIQYEYYIASKISENQFNKGNTIAVNTPLSGEFTIKEEMKLFYKDELESKVISYENNVLKMTKNIKSMNINVGDTLLGDVSEKMGTGLMHKVISKEVNENYIIFHLQELPLDEILSEFENVDIEYSIDLTQENLIIESNDKDIIVEKSEISTKSNSKLATPTISISKEFEKQGAKFNVKFDLSGDFNLKINNGNFSAIQTNNSEGCISTSYELSATSISKIKEKLGGEIEVFSIKGPSVPLNVCGVPIGSLDWDLPLIVSWNINAKGVISSKIDLPKTKHVFGLKRDKNSKIEIINKLTKSVSPKSYLGGGSAYLEGTIESKISMPIRMQYMTFDIFKAMVYAKAPKITVTVASSGSSLDMGGEFGVELSLLDDSKWKKFLPIDTSVNWTPWKESFSFWKEESKGVELICKTTNDENYLNWRQATVYSLGKGQQIPVGIYDIYGSNSNQSGFTRITRITSSDLTNDYKIPKTVNYKYFFIVPIIKNGVSEFVGPISETVSCEESYDFSKNKIDINSANEVVSWQYYTYLSNGSIAPSFGTGSFLNSDTNGYYQVGAKLLPNTEYVMIGELTNKSGLNPVIVTVLENEAYNNVGAFHVMKLTNIGQKYIITFKTLSNFSYAGFRIAGTGIGSCTLKNLAVFTLSDYNQMITK